MPDVITQPNSRTHMSKRFHAVMVCSLGYNSVKRADEGNTTDGDRRSPD